MRIRQLKNNIHAMVYEFWTQMSMGIWTLLLYPSSPMMRKLVNAAYNVHRSEQHPEHNSSYMLTTSFDKALLRMPVTALRPVLR